MALAGTLTGVAEQHSLITETTQKAHEEMLQAVAAADQCAGGRLACKLAAWAGYLQTVADFCRGWNEAFDAALQAMIGGAA